MPLEEINEIEEAYARIVELEKALASLADYTENLAYLDRYERQHLTHTKRVQQARDVVTAVKKSPTKTAGG